MPRQVALCGIAKLENHYIREWVEYHKLLGFNKIFLYDNNDPDGEHFEEVLNDYILSGYVKVIDARGKKDYQVEAYDDCYQKYNKDFDWFLFLDIDEFFTLRDYKTIQDYLAEQEDGFGNAITISYRWKYYDDNGLVKVENNNYNVLTRFIKPAPPGPEDLVTKYLVKTRVPDLHINGVHQLKKNASIIETSAEIKNTIDLTYRNGTGYFKVKENLAEVAPVYIRHFKYKTIQEYLETKCQRGYPMPYKDSGTLLGIREFFIYNALTVEKLQFIQEWLEAHHELPQAKRMLITEELEKLWDSNLIKEQLEHK